MKKSLALLLAAVCLRKNEPLGALPAKAAQARGKPGALLVYGLLFLLCLLAVLKCLPVWAAVLCVAAALLWLDRGALAEIDYSLLLTFVGFFLFVGNMGRIPALRAWLSGILLGREVPVAVLLSQVISNVPATLLLSGFTQAWQPLLIGVNLGGLGTVIASMASLISYKAMAGQGKSLGRYMACFTVVNVLFLLVLLGVYGLLAVAGCY